MCDLRCACLIATWGICSSVESHRVFFFMEMKVEMLDF